MNTSVQFVKPSAILQDVIDFYYFLDIKLSEVSNSTLNHYHVHISEGRVEMLIGLYNSSFKIRHKNKELVSHKTMLFGTRDIDNLIQSADYTSTFKGVVVRFSFHGFFKLFKISLAEFKNDNYETDEVFGNEMLRLRDKLEHARNNSESISFLNSYFTKQIASNYNPKFMVVRCNEAFRIINQYKGSIKLPKLLDHLGVSERTLERDFNTIGGVSPKNFCNTTRLNSVINKLYNDRTADWAELVHDNCYYDQAHMIKEFKKATKVTPEWFFKNKYQEVFKNNNQLIFPIASQLSNSQYSTIINATDEGYKTYLKDETGSKDTDN